MKALLIVAHGSRRSQSNEEVMALSERVEALAGSDFDLVSCAFLELAEPLIPDGISRLVAKGARDVSVVPYFLAAGTHVTHDIPAEVAKSQLEHPQVVITLTEYLGAQPGIAEMLVGLAKQA